jgi:hypothetical protein
MRRLHQAARSPDCCGRRSSHSPSIFHRRHRSFLDHRSNDTGRSAPRSWWTDSRKSRRTRGMSRRCRTGMGRDAAHTSCRRRFPRCCSSRACRWSRMCLPFHRTVCRSPGCNTPRSSNGGLCSPCRSRTRRSGCLRISCRQCTRCCRLCHRSRCRARRRALRFGWLCSYKRPTCRWRKVGSQRCKHPAQRQRTLRIRRWCKRSRCRSFRRSPRPPRRRRSQVEV